MKQAARAFPPGSPENVDKCPQPQIALIEKSERFLLPWLVGFLNAPTVC